jgi:hypothetical protein
MGKVVIKKVETYQERLFCETPCEQELKLEYIASGAFKTFVHRCSNGHMENRTDNGFPRIIYKEIAE